MDGRIAALLNFPLRRWGHNDSDKLMFKFSQVMSRIDEWREVKNLNFWDEISDPLSNAIIEQVAPHFARGWEFATAFLETYVSWRFQYCWWNQPLMISCGKVWCIVREEIYRADWCCRWLWRSKTWVRRWHRCGKELNEYHSNMYLFSSLYIKKVNCTIPNEECWWGAQLPYLRLELVGAW